MSVGCVVNVLNESELRKKKKPLENAKIAVNISGKVSKKIFLDIVVNFFHSCRFVYFSCILSL